MKSTDLNIDTDFSLRNNQDFNNFDQHISSLYETHEPKFNYPPVFLKDKDEMISQKLWGILSRNIINPLAPQAKIYNYKKFLPEKFSPILKHASLRKHRAHETNFFENGDNFSETSNSATEDLISPEKSNNGPFKSKSILKGEMYPEGRREKEKKTIKLQPSFMKKEILLNKRTPALTGKRLKESNSSVNLKNYFEQAKRQRNKSELTLASGPMYDPNEIIGREDQTVKRAQDIFESIVSESDHKEIKKRLNNIKSKLKTIFVMTQGLSYSSNNKTNPQEIKEITNKKLNEWKQDQEKLLDNLKVFNCFLSRRKSCVGAAYFDAQTEKMQKFANIFTTREVEIIKYNHSHPENKSPYLNSLTINSKRRTIRSENVDKLSQRLGKMVNEEMVRRKSQNTESAGGLGSENLQERFQRANSGTLEGNIFNDLISDILLALEDTGRGQNKINGDGKKLTSRLGVTKLAEERRKSRLLSTEEIPSPSNDLDLSRSHLSVVGEKKGSNKSIPPSPTYHESNKIVINSFVQSGEPDLDFQNATKTEEGPTPIKSKVLKKKLMSLITPLPSKQRMDLNEDFSLDDSQKKKSLLEAQNLVCSFSSKAKPFFSEKSEVMLKSSELVYRSSVKQSRDFFKCLMSKAGKKGERNLTSMLEESKLKSDVKVPTSVRNNFSLLKSRRHDLDYSTSIKSFNEERGNSTELPLLINKSISSGKKETKKKLVVKSSLPYLFNIYSKKNK